MGRLAHKEVKKYFTIKPPIGINKNPSYVCQFCGKMYVMNVTRMRKHLSICFKCPVDIRAKFKDRATNSVTTTSIRPRLNVDSESECSTDLDSNSEPEELVGRTRRTRTSTPVRDSMIQGSRASSRGSSMSCSQPQSSLDNFIDSMPSQEEVSSALLFRPLEGFLEYHFCLVLGLAYIRNNAHV